MPVRPSPFAKKFAVTAAGVLLAQSLHAATVTLTATNGPGTSSFASATSWSNAAAPSAANDYVVASARSLRTVADSGSATFAGNSLTLGDGATAGILIFKNQATGAVVTVNNLTLNNGEIQAGGTSSGAANTTTLAGNGVTLTNGSSNRINTGAAGRGIIVSAPISGGGSLDVNGLGAGTLTGANTYTGATSITGATTTLSLGNNGTTGSLSPSSSITNNGILAFRRTDTITQGTDFGTVTAGTGQLQQLGSGTVILNTANTYSGLTTIGANAGTSVLRVTANGAVGTGAIFIAGNGGSNRLELSGGVTLSNAINHNGKGNTVGQAAGVLNVSGSNTLSGTVTVQTGGSDSTFQSDAGLLTFSGATAITTNATGARNILLTGAGNIAVTGAVTNGTGTVSIAKQGTGTLTLSGTNTYTGTTNVNAGTLLVNGSLANTTVTVDSTGTLGGSGTIAGATTVNGTLSAGNSPGVLTFSGNLSLGSGSTSLFELNGLTRGTEYDGVNVGGALTYGGALSLSFNAPIAAGTYDLFGGGYASQSGTFASVSVGGSFAESFSSGPAITGTGWTAGSAGWSYVFDNLSGDLTISAVPEPSSFAVLAGLATLGLVGARRRRR